ncbi:hypothetical protein [Xenorhabdus cabanillasii]|uniref:Uncharacterized protein n=1 Tax=Xenorhabdus cabanillasii JM26 TaxID=1427517 RepID=W1J6H8_9GAMM|nr:hypothetical protein [Xenorhabdus cabanillasii]PHM75747.1 hypothetical protein Xcab_03733 [Xenorhabdus cabanillasii JM26]CDL86334.1 conserved hypothetical protein [Xenorhabdus cabanillasii JM26]
MSRNSIVVTLAVQNNIPSIHFCCHPVLSGTNNDLWIPIGTYSANPMDLFRAVGHNDLFRAIEDIMTANYYCNNIVSVQQVLQLTSNCMDFKVLYNERS